MFSKQLLHSSFVRLSLIAVVLCSITLLGGRSTGQAKAANSLLQQNTETTVESSPQGTSDQIFIQCTVDSVGTDYATNVVSIDGTNCLPSTGAITRFVIPADSKKANQVLSIALIAQVTGRRINMIYDSTDTSGLAHPESQRKILAVGVNQQ